MQRLLRNAIVCLLILMLGCRQEVFSPEDPQTFETYSSLEEDEPIELQAVLLKECFVDGKELTRPTKSIGRPRGATINITGEIAPGELGISGITCSWGRQKGDPDGVPGTTVAVTRSNDPTFGFLCLIYGSDLTKNGGCVSGELVQVRQRGKIDEFRVRFDAPKKRGKYVIDLRLQFEDIRPLSVKNKPKRVNLPLWRCMVTVY